MLRTWLRQASLAPLRGARLVLRTRLPPRAFSAGTWCLRHQAAASTYAALRAARLALRTRLPPRFQRGNARWRSHLAAASTFPCRFAARPGASHQARRLRRQKSRRDGGFWGKFFVKFWANFCTLPPRFKNRGGAKKFSRFSREKSRGERNFRDFRAKIARFRAKKFSRFSREKSRGERRKFFARASRRASRGGQKTRRGDGFRALRARKIKIKFF